MATPTKLDIQAVKDAMAKTPGLNYVDAARQVRGVQNPVAPITAPVAPLVPTPTVAPITNQEVQQGVNAVGGTAEQRRQTRTDITANQTIAPPVAPVSPSVTESPAPVTEKTGITQDAFQQAQAKSAEIKAQNDAVMAQNKQKSDLAREDAALAAQAAIPTDKKGIVNAMVTGASIPVQKTEAYNKAVVTSDLFKKFSGMTSDQLFQNLQQGQIGTELSGLLASNPNFAIAKQKYEQVQKTNAINTQTNAMYNAANGKENTVVDELGKIESKYSAPPGTNAQAYEQFVTQDPDVVKSGLELKNLATQINTVTKTYNDALKSLKEQYPDMPASALITLMGTRTKDTKELLDSYISAKELAKGDFDLAMKMADGHYNAVSKDIAVQQQEAQQIAQEQRQMQNTLALGQAQFDQKLAQQAQLANDPTTQIQSTMDEFSKLGIIAQGDLTSKLAEFKSSGKTLPEYITGLRKQFMSKPEYKKLQELESGKLSDAQKFSMQNAVEDRRDIRNFAQQKELAYLNKDLSRQQFLFELENDPAQKAKAYELEQKLNANKSLFDVLGKNVGTYEGNRGYDLAGAIGDPLPSGGNWTVKSIDTAGEQVGSIFIGGKGSKPYGNTVVMQDENGNEIRYSHLQNIGVKPGDVLGFGDIVGTRGNTGNVMGANGEKLTEEQLKAGRGAHLDVEIKSNGKLLSNKDQVEFLKGLKATPSLGKEELKAISTARTNLEQDPQYKAYRTLANQVADVKGIQARINNGTATPQDQQQMITAFSKVLDPTSVVRESEFELTKKYGQAGYQALLQNVSQYWRGDGILNPESAKILAESLANRYGSIEQEYNNQLQLAKDNIEMNIGRGLSNKEFETLTQTKFSNQSQQSNPETLTKESVQDLYSKWKSNKK